MAVAVLVLAAILAVSSRRIAGLVKTGEYDIPRPGFIRAYIIGAGVLISLLVIYQSAVEGIFFRALKIENPEQRVAKLYRLSRAPSGYAPLYFQLGEEFRKSFIYSDKTEFGIQSTKYYEFAAELNPEDYQTYFQWAETVYRLGVAIRTFKIFSESGDLCAKAAQLGPGQVFSYLLLSNIEYVKKDYRRSEHWLRTALGYEPYFLRARSRLIALLLEQEDLDEGGREFQKLEAQLKESSGLLSRPDNGLSGYQKLLLATDPDELSAIEKKLRAQPIPPLFQKSR
jgi:hypothetical protein